MEGHPKIFRLLLEAGANPHIADREGWTPLAYLSRFRQDNVQLFKLLLAAGVNVNVKTEDGWTPLALAANCGSLEAVKILLAAGADPNSGTPLTKAAFHEHLEIVKTLLAVEGIDTDLKGSDWLPALWIDRQPGYLRAADLIHQHRMLKIMV